jgi:hypothetical protein
VRVGEGNVDMRGWVRKYAQLCPGRAIDLEVIVGGSRVHRIYDAKFWDGYRNVRAYEFMRFLALAEKSTPPPAARLTRLNRSRGPRASAPTWRPASAPARRKQSMASRYPRSPVE